MQYTVIIRGTKDDAWRAEERKAKQLTYEILQSIVRRQIDIRLQFDLTLIVDLEERSPRSVADHSECHVRKRRLQRHQNKGSSINFIS